MSKQIGNRTKFRVRIKGAESQQVLLAPFEQRVLSDDEFSAFNRIQMTRQGLVRVEEVPTIERVDRVVGLAFWGVIAYIIVGAIVGAFWFWVLGAFSIIAGISAGLVGVRRGWWEVLRWGRQIATLVIVLAIGIGIPVAALWNSTGLAEFGTPLNRFYELLSESPQRRVVIERILQVGFIAIASLLPGLMYYLFDRTRLATLRERFVHQIFRLDPTLLTESDLVAKYGSQMDKTYGSSTLESSGARFAAGRRSPVIVATLLITIGWTFILLNPDAQSEPNFELARLFTPSQSAVAFAFLGGYFYSLRVVLRGYVRGDLKPKTYTNVAVRLILVVVLAWVLEAIIAEPTWLIYPSAFIAGIVPDTFLKSVADKVSQIDWIGSSASDELSEGLDLSKLEGIDLYDRSRLEEEGVSNIEALAHCDLVDLMLRTRIPVPQLVDWVDQAILFLHTRPPEGDGADSLHSGLKDAGIRTASDLYEAVDAARFRGDVDSFFGRFDPDEDETPTTLRIVLDTFSDEEWLPEICFWHSSFGAATFDRPGADIEGGELIVTCDVINPRTVITRMKNDRANAAEILREGLRNLPKSHELATEYGNLLYKEAAETAGPASDPRYIEALSFFQRALSANDSSVIARANKVLVLFTLKRDEEAKNELANVLKAAPHPVIELEMQFYSYALVTDDQPKALNRIGELLDGGTRDPEWPLNAIVERAIAEDAHHGAVVADLASVISGQRDWEEDVKPTLPSQVDERKAVTM